MTNEQNFSTEKNFDAEQAKAKAAEAAARAKEQADAAKAKAAERTEQAKAKLNEGANSDKAAQAQEKAKEATAKARLAADEAAAKASEAVHKNRAKIDSTVDKAAELIDAKTQGKATGVVSKIKQVIASVLDKAETRSGSTVTPGTAVRTEADQAAQQGSDIDAGTVAEDPIERQVARAEQSGNSSEAEVKPGRAAETSDDEDRGFYGAVKTEDTAETKAEGDNRV